jgi:nitrogen fixation protein FixH
MQAPIAKASRRWDPWPVSIIVFFSLAIIGCVSFVIFCTRHPVDLVASDYYDQEVRYQDRLESLNRTRGAQAGSVSLDAARKAILVHLPREHVASGLSGQVELYRPSAQQLDKRFPLRPGTDGVQTIDAAGLPDGLWKVRVSWAAGGQSYQLEEKIVLGAVSAR